jgi:hypothetical protein
MILINLLLALLAQLPAGAATKESRNHWLAGHVLQAFFAWLVDWHACVAAS